MAKKNVLQDFIDYSIANEECSAVKGGRANTPVNTGSFGFIDWGDVEIRNDGVVSSISSAAVVGVVTKG